MDDSVADTELAPFSELSAMADRVRNWGRWGDGDEVGALNFITADHV
jgi:hypothetical protein